MRKEKMVMGIDSITETQAQKILKFLAKKCLMPDFMYNIYMHKEIYSMNFASYANVYFGFQPLNKRFVLRLCQENGHLLYTMKFPGGSRITWKMVLDVVMCMGEQYNECLHMPYDIYIEDVYMNELYPLNPHHMTLEEILILIDLEP